MGQTYTFVFSYFYFKAKNNAEILMRRSALRNSGLQRFK